MDAWRLLRVAWRAKRQEHHTKQQASELMSRTHASRLTAHACSHRITRSALATFDFGFWILRRCSVQVFDFGLTIIGLPGRPAPTHAAESFDFGFWISDFGLLRSSDYRFRPEKLRFWIWITLHLITRSALARTLGGIVSPICFAVLRLIARKILSTPSTGKFEGLLPPRMRWTCFADTRPTASRSTL